MNKRTIMLLSVCFLLAIATLTIRYIEQEKESIKARFVGQEPAEEKQSPRGSYSRGVQPGAIPAEDVPGPVKREGNQQPPAAAMMPSSAGAVPMVAQPSPPSAAPPPVRQVPAAPGGEKAEGRGTITLPEPPVSAALDEVTTPLGSEEPAAAPEAHGGGGADAAEAKATVVDEKITPEGAGENAGDAVKTLAVEEQAGQVAADGDMGEKIQEEDNDAAAQDEGVGEEGEAIGEGEPSEGEEATEEEHASGEGEVHQEEGATGRKEEIPYEE